MFILFGFWRRKYWILGLLVAIALIWLFNQPQSTHYRLDKPEYRPVNTNPLDLVRSLKNNHWRWQYNKPEETIKVVAQAPPSLPIELHSILALKSGRGSIILSVGQGQRQVLRPGQSSSEGVELIAIEKNKAQIKESGKLRWIFLQSHPKCVYVNDDEKLLTTSQKLYFMECQ